MAEAPKSGLLDLEKELTCSICTDVLYQPLTLLDCLHTFCGSCLKEWFSWQASQAQSASSNPYTCPSCRASVRETRPNATVTTLLDMYLQANPSRGKTAEEKEEMKKKYKPGDSVMPNVEMEKGDSEDEEDRWVVEEVRELSLREVGVQSGGSYESRVRQGGRARNRDIRDEDVRRRRRHDEARRRRREGNSAASGESGRAMGDVDRRAQARQIEHQSSLRSLLSESDSTEMEEEILRQIMDEGLLDGIDLNNMNVAQEDELSERIADAYRRRHGQRPRSQDTRSEDSRGVRSRSQRSDEHQSRQRQARSSGATEQPTHSSHPPLSRPHLLEAYPTRPDHRRRTSSGSRQPPSPEPGRSSRRSSSEVHRQAARSATDLSDRPRSSQADQVGPSGLSSHGRRTTEPPSRRRDSDSERRPVIHADPRPDATALRVSDRTTTERTTSSLGMADTTPLSGPSAQLPPSIATTTGGSSRPRAPPPHDVSSSSRPTTSSSPVVTSTPRPSLHPEPSIACDRCGKANIEHELHENCSVCRDGNFNLCLRCYRLGLGCLRWYGFGYAAWQKYERQAPPGGYPPNHSLPHRLTGHRYLIPKPESIQLPVPEASRPLMTFEDPANRLQAGVFCANCSAFTNDCLWKCDTCNEGEWGFCTRCVNQGKCCTHPLLPVAYTPDTKSNTPTQQLSLSSITSSLNTTGPYTALTFSPACSICTYPIQPSTTRFHCPQCHDQASDICTPCYLKLVSSGRISPENGDKGWRRCLRGHRMVIVGFEDSNKGQRRVIVKERVGGWGLREGKPAGEGDEEWYWPDSSGRECKIPVSKKVSARAGENASTNHHGTDGTLSPPILLTHKKFPPDGGTGVRVQALWGYWPQEGVKDELGFPRGAEVTEAEDVNGDWWIGWYAGARGLWPGNYGRRVGLDGFI
ncbi:hypothetical protein MMC08_006598 [Hypocenomyce scalaris]|nr:hypothetical protein [Hypocenomyce scalaris]